MKIWNKFVCYVLHYTSYERICIEGYLLPNIVVVLFLSVNLTFKQKKIVHIKKKKKLEQISNYSL